MGFPDPRFLLVCNFEEATSECVKGARAYVIYTNPGWGGERLLLLARSRSGRWIDKWESLKRLTGFRLTKVYDGDPIQARALRGCFGFFRDHERHYDQSHLDSLIAAKAKLAQRREATGAASTAKDFPNA